MRVESIKTKVPLPVRNGVAPSKVYLPHGSWSTVYDFLVERFPHVSAQILKERLDRGEIFSSDGYPVKSSQPFIANQWLWYYRQVNNEVVVPFEISILYENSRIVVIDKPHFLASTPGGRYLHQTALIRTRQLLNLPHVNLIHRLDKDTAGVLVFCKNRHDRGAYQSLFQKQQVKKVYEAVAPFLPNKQFPLDYKSKIVAGHKFAMKEECGEPNSYTKIKLIKQLNHNNLALYKLYPVTGRKHQLRVHLSSLGIPIVNDEIYPNLLPYRNEEDFSNPLQLLSRSISFKDPISGEQYYFESKLNLRV